MQAGWIASRCQVCGRWPARPVCGACLLRFGGAVPRCPRCAQRLPPGNDPTRPCGHCLRHPPALQACCAAVDYAYPWHHLVARFKFQGEPAWAHGMAELALQRPEVRTAVSHADWLLPIPLSSTRLARRGYNQAWELAQALGGAKLLADGLVKLVDGPDQIGLTRAQRLHHARASLAVAPRHLDALRGRHVLVVDDVMTTGATLNAAAEVLLRAGAASVGGLAFARTPDDG